MANQLIGTITETLEQRQVSQTFHVMDFMFDCSDYDRYTGEKRENIVKLQASNSFIDQILAIPEGTRVKISFAVRGKRYEKDGEQRHFQALSAFKVEALDQPKETPQNGNGISRGHDLVANHNPATS